MRLIKKIPTTIICLILCVYALSAQERSLSPEQAITQTRNELWEAVLKTDLEAVGRLVSDDYVETESDGTVSSKTDLIETLKEFAAVPYAKRPPPPVIDDVKIRIYGDTALMTGRSTDKRVDQYRFTDFYVREKGQWRLVSSQMTIIKQKK